MTGKQSNILPTDEEPLSSLLSPDCEIPSDIQFEIFDEAGTLLGTLGGHKNLMALRSPVFKRMFYGPLKEKGNTVQVKFTSLVAFNALLKHSLDFGWHLADKHLLFDVFQVYVFCFLVEKGDKLRWPLAIPLESVEDDCSTLLFGSTIFRAEISKEFVPFCLGGVTPEEIINSRVEIHGELCL